MIAYVSNLQCVRQHLNIAGVLQTLTVTKIQSLMVSPPRPMIIPMSSYGTLTLHAFGLA